MRLLRFYIGIAGASLRVPSERGEPKEAASRKRRKEQRDDEEDNDYTTTTMTMTTRTTTVVALAETIPRYSVRTEGTKKGAGERVERGRRTGDSGEWWAPLCARAALEREERRDESEGRKREPGDRWPFQTMRNSGDKGGARARMREGREEGRREEEAEKREGERVGEREDGRREKDRR